ncbi:MAG TPA: dihydroxy-acid dehydratase, partial [Sphingobacteriaceae bacterium]
MVEPDKHTSSLSTTTKGANGRAAVGEKYELNKYSKTLTQDPTLPAAQAMLYGIGLTEDDLKKAQVGVVSTGYDGNTCNMHLNKLAQEVKTAVWDNDRVGLMFHTIGV